MQYRITQFIRHRLSLPKNLKDLDPSSLQKNLKDLDPSCKMDLDLWGFLGRENPFRADLHKNDLHI